MAYASWSEARGAAFQLLLNVIVLIVVGALVLRAQRMIWHARELRLPLPPIQLRPAAVLTGGPGSLCRSRRGRVGSRGLR
jgi:hypothetical protein